MMSLITVGVCLATYMPSIAAASNTTASPSALSTSTATACGAAADICPACDLQNITDASGASYKVYCNSIISSTELDAVTNAQAAGTPRLCMEACDEFAGCIGAYYYVGSCVLATGALEGIVQETGNTAFLRYAATAFASSSALSSRSMASTRVHTSSHATATGVLASSTSGASSNTSSSCKAAAIGCPSCDGEEVTDSRGQTYKVYCDYQLFADSDYSVQSWTSPSGCLLECDNYTWCKGATFWPQGNCELAKGADVFPQEMPGYTAFLPAPDATKTPNPQNSPSRYPTGTIPPVTTHNTRSAYTFKTVTDTLVGSSTTLTAPTCTPSAARCPVCHGVTTTDTLNQTYTITCASEPICQDSVNKGTAFSQDVCMKKCDADPICFAALWNNTQCHLCEGAIDGFVDAPAEYVVFLAGNTTASATAPSSVPVTTTAVSLSSAIPASQVTCPTDSSTDFTDPTDGRLFNIQCDTGLGAASHRFASAADFAACAAQCTSDCGGIEYGSSTSCGLYTAISVISAASGWTAGVYVMHPPSAAATTAAAMTTSLTTSSVLHAQTFITAPAPGSTDVAITATLASLGRATSAPSITPTTSSVAFVPPLVNGSVSYATPGGETRRAA